MIKLDSSMFQISRSEGKQKAICYIPCVRTFCNQSNYVFNFNVKFEIHPLYSCF